MWNPAVAVIWETWRLTRRRVLVVLTLGTLCAVLLSKQGHLSTSPLAFVVLFVVAMAMAVSMPLFGARSGFPLQSAFARPIRTSVLVAAPLAYVFVAVAASYLVPAMIVRFLNGVEFPLIPVAIMVGALAVLVAGCSWITRSAMLRAALIFAALIVAGAMFRFLDPFRNASGFFGPRATVTPDVFVLSGSGYLALVLLTLGLYVVMVAAVEWQRHGDEELSFPHAAGKAASGTRGDDIVVWVRNTCVRVFRWRCPVSSPTAAEVWFELQYYGIPVLVIGALLSLCIPLLVQWGKATQSGIPIVLAACTFAFPFLAGVSASIWNRRNSSRTEVSAFEAARAIGTAQLIGLQVLIASVCIAGAWLLMSLSFWLSYDSVSGMSMNWLRALSTVILSFVLLATVLALLASLRALVSSYGWRLWMALIAVAVYALGLAVAVSRDWVDEAAIGVHMWAVAVAMSIGTLVILGKALSGSAVSPRHLGIAVLVWLPFAVLYLETLRTAVLADAPPALVALALTSTLLPLAAVGLAPWSLSRIRHA